MIIFFFFLLFYYSSVQSKSIISSLLCFLNQLPKPQSLSSYFPSILSVNILFLFSPLTAYWDWITLLLLWSVSLHHQPPQFPQMVVPEAEEFLVSPL